MNINIDCMRKVLEFCIENIDYEEINSNEWQEKYVDLNMLYDSKKLKKYKHKDIMHSVMKLHEIQFLKLKDILPTNTSYINSCTITDVTMLGHNFYDSVKDDNVWNKTKNLVFAAGNHTINFIEETAQKVAVASVQQAVAVMMTKNQ